ncbi:MAG TPA: Uma2 family endonuclease, partial [Acidimicrobiales bacterium]|nr:Uma2 family endonuclease [Acidimicrobiales bacterium]
MESTETPQPLVRESPAAPAVTLQQWRRIPPERRAELFDGRLYYQGMPGRKHGRIQGRIYHVLTPFDAEEEEEEGQAARDRPGGWWFSLETDISLLGHGFRPDVVGWRTDHYPEPPVVQREGLCKGLITGPPDWTCEVLSKGSKRVDLGRKREVYHQAGVGHYWVVDP